jgi:tRNA U38,U39,U40 pseudouridine synthase TruA
MLGLNLSITTACTLQGYLWAALRRLRLVPEDSDWHVLRYSRCGRTDKGVSALGQVGRHHHGDRVMQARQADV